MSEKLLTVTDRARNRALAVRAEEPDGDQLVLFLEVTEPGGLEYGYDLYFDDASAIREGDIVQEEGELKIAIPADSADKLVGATLDLSKNLLNPGWVVDNPNTPSPSPAVGARGGAPGAPPFDPSTLTGTVEERVATVLEQVVNPAIASHGGSASLIAVDDDGTVFVQLSGGCQGCGMAKVTLTQGIEVSLKELVPEVVQVVDTTDHASGENPYFQQSKK